MSDMIGPDVLVVGCGPAGLAMAMSLARQGTSVLAVTKHRQLAPTPRSHVTNQRTFEIFRDFGLEEEALSLATDYAVMPDQIFMRSLVGEEFGRIAGLGQEAGSSRNDSPCRLADLPQHLLEPMLFRAATRLGALVRFGTELVSFSSEAHGVTAILRDDLSAEPVEIHAQYMIGADGGNSLVAQGAGLPFEGAGEIGGSLNILFESDLAPYIAHRPGLLYFLVRTSNDPEGPGFGILRSVKPWNQWLMIKGYAAGQDSVDMSHEAAAEVVRAYVGVPDLELRIDSVDPWRMNSLCATTFQRGRVFCMGDAVHRHVPSNGLGSNTAIQDAHNLAWKLDLVLKGKADAKLLESYSEERVPVGKNVVRRATMSLESYTPILEAIGAVEQSEPEAFSRNVAEIGAATPDGTIRRRAIGDSIHAKRYEFQARGLELNHFYESCAIIGEDQKREQDDRDPDLFYQPSTCPGAYLPHAWIQRCGRSLSTLDLVGKGRFTVLTGVGGEAWIAAAEAAAERFAIAIPAFAIGPGCEFSDLYFEWERRGGISESGCLLVRPDGHVAWRCKESPGAFASRALNGVLDTILGARACLDIVQTGGTKSNHG